MNHEVDILKDLYFFSLDAPKVGLEAQKKFYDKQDNFLLSIMNGCNKTALLPNYACKQLALQLELNGHQQILVGKEVYTNVSEVFSITGFVPYYLRRRMEGMEVSGIWEWWSKIVTHKYMLFQNRSGAGVSTSSLHTRPTMGGNILLIFISCSVGLFVSAVIFIEEARGQMIKRSKHFLNVLALSFRFFSQIDPIIWEDPKSYKVSLETDLKVCKSKRYLKRINLQIRCQ